MKILKYVMEIKINRFFIAYFWSKFHKNLNPKHPQSYKRERETNSITSNSMYKCARSHKTLLFCSTLQLLMCVLHVCYYKLTNLVNIQTEHFFSYLFIYFFHFRIQKKNDERDERRNRIRCNEDDANMIITYSIFFFFHFIFLFTINFSACCCLFIFLLCHKKRENKANFRLCVFLSWII